MTCLAIRVAIIKERVFMYCGKYRQYDKLFQALTTTRVKMSILVKSV